MAGGSLHLGRCVEKGGGSTLDPVAKVPPPKAETSADAGESSVAVDTCESEGGIADSVGFTNSVQIAAKFSKDPMPIPGSQPGGPEALEGPRWRLKPGPRPLKGPSGV